MTSGDTIRLTLRWSFTFAFHFSVSFFHFHCSVFSFTFFLFFLSLFNLIFQLFLINFSFSHSHFDFHLITYQSGIQRHSLFLHNGNHSKNVFLYPVPDSKPHPPFTSHQKNVFFPFNNSILSNLSYVHVILVECSVLKYLRWPS